MDNMPLEGAVEPSWVSQDAGGVTLRAGSGSYEFRYRYA
jgi:hypothetical protein